MRRAYRAATGSGKRCTPLPTTPKPRATVCHLRRRRVIKPRARARSTRALKDWTTINGGATCPNSTNASASLETKLKQLKVRQQRIDARARALSNRRARKDDTRRKILIGATVLARIDRHELDHDTLQAWLDAHLDPPRRSRALRSAAEVAGVIADGLFGLGASPNQTRAPRRPPRATTDRPGSPRNGFLNLT